MTPPPPVMKAQAERIRPVLEGEDPLHGLERLSRAIEAVRRGGRSPAVRVVPWMNVKHPVSAVQLRVLRQAGLPLRPGRLAGCAGRIVLRGVSGFLYAVLFSLRLMALRLRFLHILRRARSGPFEVILKSWRIGLEGLPAESDFYYGDLARRLGERGIPALTIWGDVRGGNWRVRPSAEKQSLPELLLAPLLSPLGIWIRQAGASLQLLRNGLSSRDRLVAEVSLQAAEDCLWHRLLPIALYEPIGAEAVRIWSPRAVIALYEGHAWEQCFWHGARSQDASCATVGYQHTVLFRHSLSLLKGPQEGGGMIKPDIVLGLGERPLQLLRSSHPSCRLIPFGSFRWLDSVPSGGSGPRPDKRTVLVLPEGHAEEVVLLFHHALRLAAALPDHRFVLRCHPALPLKRVQGDLEERLSDHPNVELSSGRRLGEDFNRSSALLYRGSSSVLYGILAGLKPLYLKDSLLGEIDALHELDVWREKASTVSDSLEILRRYSEAGAEQCGEWSEAVRYVRSYVRPVGEDSLELLLKALDEGRRAPR